MLQVYKYPIPAQLLKDENGRTVCRWGKEFSLEIPNPGMILKMSVQPSRDPNFQIWVLVDPDNPSRERKFLFMGTGQPTPHKSLLFIDTWVTDGLVFHLFEVMNHELEADIEVAEATMKIGGSQ